MSPATVTDRLREDVDEQISDRKPTFLLAIATDVEPELHEKIHKRVSLIATGLGLDDLLKVRIFNLPDLEREFGFV